MRELGLARYRLNYSWREELSGFGTVLGAAPRGEDLARHVASSSHKQGKGEAGEALERGKHVA